MTNKELAVRTSAAFMLFDILARVLDERGILDRGDLADDILDIVKTRRTDLQSMAQAGNPAHPGFNEALTVIENFAKGDLRTK